VRILLAAAPHRDTFGYSMPPPGLLRLGGALERERIDVALEDLSYRLAAGELPEDDRLADAACAALIARGTFDVVGISVMGATLPIALAILERLRAHDRAVRTWLGGPGTTGLDRTILERFAFVDAVVRGEGELTRRAPVRRGRARGATFEGIDGGRGATCADSCAARTIARRSTIWQRSRRTRGLLPPIAAYKANHG
jgi:hypothetical protein